MLSFECVSLGYEGRTVVENLSLELRPGELLTLLGPSGCGKSTLIAAAGGFLSPLSGRILIGGRDVTSLPPEKRPTATIFQNHALFPHFNVMQNVCYGLRARGVPRPEREKAAAAMLEKVGLAGFGPRSVRTLSGGQQQRTALARTLVLHPDVLLLDEPLSSLDAPLRIQLRAEIRSLQQEFGITALYVTHDHAEAFAVSDRIAVMNSGRIEQVGTREELRRNPASGFVEEFIRLV